MIKAKNIMTREVITAPQSMTLAEAAKLMASKSVSSLVVVENGSPVAIISEKDIIKGAVSKKARARDFMSSDFAVISPMTGLAEINKAMKDKGIARFPVSESGRLVGLVTETDVIEATRDLTRFHQIVQEVVLGVFGLATAFFLFYFSPLGESIFR